MLKIDQYEINGVACPYDLSTENHALDLKIQVSRSFKIFNQK